jgi:prepilin-type N-terminal cleavage/methylation domain-containing protein
LRKRSKKLLSGLASASPARAGAKSQKFFGSFFQKTTASFTRPLGFTLLETLVALTIVAIAFATAFGAMPESLNAQARARNLETATDLAESVLAQGSATAVIGAEGKFAWRKDTAPVAGTQLQRPGEFGGQTVRVTVEWREGSNLRSIRLDMLRLGMLPRGT